jgi:hypothetical protein
MRAARGLPVIVLSVALVACGGLASPSASVVPSAEPTADASQPNGTPQLTGPPATAEPSLDPTQVPEPSRAASSNATWATNPPTPILMAAMVRVTVAELNLREYPFTSSRRTGTVARDTIIYTEPVPPVDSDGHIWYRGSIVSTDGDVPALPAPIPDTIGDDLFGWFAAGTRETDFVSRVEPRCPGVVNLKHVAAMTAFERLACFDDTIEVEGTFRCFTTCLAHAFGDFEPEWLAARATLDFVFADSTDKFGLVLRFPPTVERPDLGAQIRVRGHLRDAAAERCTMSGNHWWPPDDDVNHPYPDVVARYLCRQEFVVERYEVIGEA